MAPALRCPLCRQSFFSGRGHVYSRKHQRQLRVALERLLPQVEAARKAVRTVQVERYSPEHDQCCWCLCCGCEVQKHLSHGNMTVLHGGLLEHLACPDHRKATNKFWWENKADVLLKEKFLVSQQDYSRFKKSMVKALDSYEEKEDEMIKKMAAQIREVERSRQEVVQSVLEVGFQRRLQSSIHHGWSRVALSSPASHLLENTWTSVLLGTLPTEGALAFQDIRLALEITIVPQAVPDPEEGCSAPCIWKGTNRIASSSQHLSLDPLLHAPELKWMEATQSLTFIGHQDTPGVGNVHSGATPPWLLQDDEDCNSSAYQIGPSYEEFLKEKEKQKLRKLPPDRVGANFDHCSSTGAGWLPSFGRVWNNGRRWQSRHQFKAETKQ